MQKHSCSEKINLVKERKRIFAIIGSASRNSVNQKLVEKFAALVEEELSVTIFNSLRELPHFDPEESIHNPPPKIVELRKEIEQADGILICTPEYVFGLPGGLKNAIEWCVSTTVFSDKPAGLITASASGKKCHEELQLIMRTVMARFTEDTALLIEGIKGKMNAQGDITEDKTLRELVKFAAAYKTLLKTVH
jgi:NAD(P)H-dependent FMN reductase